MKISKNGSIDLTVGHVLAQYATQIHKARKFLMLNDGAMTITADIDDGGDLTFKVESHFQERTDEIAFWDAVRHVAHTLGGELEPLSSWEQEDGEYIQQKIEWAIPGTMLYEHFEFKVDILKQSILPLWEQAGIPIL